MHNRLSIRIANEAWRTACLPAYLCFRSALGNPAVAQKRILERLLATNSGSAYGRKHHFSRLRTAKDFQQAVPIVSYDDLQPWVERIKDGEESVLTTERVLMFEKTSGSASAAKYIPYTASLRREFQRAIRIWIYDLYSHTPGLTSGNAYWCITPLARESETTAGGLPVGFESDSQYLGSIEEWLLRELLA